VASEIGVELKDVEFRATPKLDGMAGKLTEGQLITRGDGLVGNDVTNAIEKGVYPVCGLNTGTGEIVMLKKHFENHMADEFSHPRNVVVGAVSADTPNEMTQAALDAKAIRFVPYSSLKAWTGNARQLLGDVDAICEKVEDCPYPIDGTVIEITHEKLKEAMGSGSHHHNWQLAKKTRGESKACKVLDVTWQVGRTGRITPVINIEPTSISGAVISNVTGHHAGNIKERGVGVGAIINVERSGEVIPYLASVIETVDAEIPAECPCCGHPTNWEKDFLVCYGSNCSAQREAQILHWFKILGNVDGFGPSAVKKILKWSPEVQIHDLYQFVGLNFVDMGFGPGQAANLVTELERSRTDAINDWRFLAAFGIHHLGRGDSKKLLKHFTISDLKYATEDAMRVIDGFGSMTAGSISADIAERYDEIMALYDLGFNIIQTKRENDADEGGPNPGKLADEFIVFTGGMTMGTRDTMKESAEVHSATPQSSINKKTTILVIGNKASAAKITKAEGLGAKVLTEAEYYELIA